MTKYDLYRLLKDELGNGSSDLVTRPSGNKIRERIEKDIAKEKDGAVVALDFSKIGIIDFSCADEIVAKLVSRLISGEYGDRYIILTGLNENQKENIEVALERKDLAVMGAMKNKVKTLIGNLDNYLNQTLNLILDKETVTAKELSDALSLPANTSGTRLLNLYKKRLVKRTEEMRESGRVWVYATVQQQASLQVPHYGFTIVHRSIPEIGLFNEKFYLLMSENGSNKHLHRLDSESPQEDVLEKYPEDVKNMERILRRFHETSKYMLYYNSCS